MFKNKINRSFEKGKQTMRTTTFFFFVQKKISLPPERSCHETLQHFVFLLEKEKVTGMDDTMPRYVDGGTNTLTEMTK